MATKNASCLKEINKFILFLALISAIKSVDCQHDSTAGGHVADVYRNKDGADFNGLNSNNSFDLKPSEESEGFSDLVERNKWRHDSKKRARSGRRHFDGQIKDGGDFNWMTDDFVMKDNLPDGEREKRIRYRGISAKETSVESHGEGLILRQLTDGLHFVQTISNVHGEMIDCEYIQDDSTVRKFLKDFAKELTSNFLKNHKSFERKRRKNKKERYDSRLTQNERFKRHRQNSEPRHVKKSHEMKKELDYYADLHNSGNWRDFDSLLEDDVKEMKQDSSNDEDSAIFRDDYRFKKSNVRSRRASSFFDSDSNSKFFEDYFEYEPLSEDKRRVNFDDRIARSKSTNRRILADKFDKFGFRNVTVTKLGGGVDLPDDVAEWLSYKTLEEKCSKVHRQLEKMLAMKHSQVDLNEDETLIKKRDRRALRGLAIAPGMLWCGAGDIAESTKELGELKGPDACCRAHDLCPRGNIHTMERKYGVFNYNPFTITHCQCDRSTSRTRVARSTGMLVPGTRWCGRGGAATRHSELGEFGGADRCCRTHDTACPFWIGAVETKYGLFNWRPNTLMHCRCDERFRSCLKLANSDAANMVGRLFFNVVQTKCFVLKPAKVCTERSWWGKCLNVGYAKQAHLRENPTF